MHSPASPSPRTVWHPHPWLCNSLQYVCIPTVVCCWQVICLNVPPSLPPILACIKWSAVLDAHHTVLPARCYTRDRHWKNFQIYISRTPVDRCIFCTQTLHCLSASVHDEYLGGPNLSLGENWNLDKVYVWYGGESRKNVKFSNFHKNILCVFRGKSPKISMTHHHHTM